MEWLSCCSGLVYWLRASVARHQHRHPQPLGFERRCAFFTMFHEPKAPTSHIPSHPSLLIYSSQKQIL